MMMNTLYFNQLQTNQLEMLTAIHLTLISQINGEVWS